MQIRRLGDTQDRLGESPCWDARTGTLCWIDSLAGTLHRLRPTSGRIEDHALPAPVGSIALCQSGAVVAALRNTFVRYDFEKREPETLARIDLDRPDVRFNDGKCDPLGNFIAGTMHVDRRPDDPIVGGLYRLRPDRSVERIADDIAFTNGPCFSRDGRTLYVADSLVRTIWAYRYAADGPLRDRRAFVRTERFDSGPDGATVDAEGYLWTVLTRAAKLARFAPDGSLDRLIEMPATYPTSLCFGGPDLTTVYVTSISKSARLTGPLPHDGGVFELTGLPAAGLAPHRFADNGTASADAA